MLGPVQSHLGSPPVAPCCLPSQQVTLPCGTSRDRDRPFLTGSTAPSTVPRESLEITTKTGAGSQTLPEPRGPAWPQTPLPRGVHWVDWHLFWSHKSLNPHQLHMWSQSIRTLTHTHTLPVHQCRRAACLGEDTARRNRTPQPAPPWTGWHICSLHPPTPPLGTAAGKHSPGRWYSPRTSKSKH